MPDFKENVQLITPDTIQTAYPQFYLNDINLLYSYSQRQFELQGVRVIENMIYNVMYTDIGSRWFEPEFGSRVPVIIYESCTLETANRLEIEIFASIKRWVPIINLVIQETRVIPVPDENLFVAFFNYVDIFTGLNRGFTLDLERVVR